MRAKSPEEERAFIAQLIPAQVPRDEVKLMPEDMRDEAARGREQCKKDIQMATVLAGIVGWVVGRGQR